MNYNIIANANRDDVWWKTMFGGKGAPFPITRFFKICLVLEFLMSIFRSIHKIGPLHNKLLLIISEFAFRGLGSLLCLVLCRCMSLLYSKICDRDLGRLSFTNSYTKCCMYISRKSLNFIILRCLKSVFCSRYGPYGFFLYNFQFSLYASDKHSPRV